MSTTTELGVPTIDATPNHVDICGQRVTRPASISPGQWLEFWQERDKEGTHAVRSYARPISR